MDENPVPCFQHGAVSSCLPWLCLRIPRIPWTFQGERAWFGCCGFFFLQPSFQHAEVVTDICISGLLCFQTPIAGEPFHGGICTT